MVVYLHSAMICHLLTYCKNNIFHINTEKGGKRGTSKFHFYFSVGDLCPLDHLEC